MASHRIRAQKSADRPAVMLANVKPRIILWDQTFMLFASASSRGQVQAATANFQTGETLLPVACQICSTHNHF